MVVFLSCCVLVQGNEGVPINHRDDRAGQSTGRRCANDVNAEART